MQVERERYETTDFEGKTLTELVAKFNSEHPGMSIQIPNGNSKCIIETVRNSMENEDGIVIRQDRSVVVSKGRKPMPNSIEIECKSRDRIKKAKESLMRFFDFLGIDAKSVVIKETREEQAVKLMEQDGQTGER